MDSSRGSLHVDLDALTHNLRTLRSRAEGAALVLVAKADAYGHGAVPVAHHAQRCGVEAIGVSSVGEALELRRAGIRGRLLVLGALFGEEAGAAVEEDVEVVVPSAAVLQQLDAAGARHARAVRLHVKVDTGMNRLGARGEEALELLRAVRSSPWLRLAGVMTHLAAMEGARCATGREQLARFEAVLAAARRERLLAGRSVWVHATNSATLLAGGAPRYDAVRLGAAAYGVSPDPALPARELRPVMSLRSQVVHLSEVPAGEPVGYGGTWAPRRTSRLAVVPLGYADGVDWRLSNRGVVLLHGQRVPIVGRVSMDVTTVDVTRVPGVRLGDVVTFFGCEGRHVLPVEEVARTAGTIPYAVLCSIGRRVERLYRGGVRVQDVAAQAIS